LIAVCAEQQQRGGLYAVAFCRATAWRALLGVAEADDLLQLAVVWWGMQGCVQ
jgi:hypothetical protein